jgi:hypothetical protein
MNLPFSFSQQRKFHKTVFEAIEAKISIVELNKKRLSHFFFRQ